MNGASFLRDVVFFIDSRNETLNDGKTVKQLINDFLKYRSPDPNDYDKYGRNCIGYKH